jgi:Right handed beta helix region
MLAWMMRTQTLSFMATAFLAPTGLVQAATIHLYPTQSFEQAVESLAPGDVLVVHAGDYYGSGRISIMVKGTAEQPVIIRAAENEARPHIRRAGSVAVQNTINIEGATYLTITGLEISSNGGDGINLNSRPSRITLEDLEIHDVDVGINFRSDMDNILVRRNQIHRTGASGSGTGEGMYVGCNYAECVVRDSIIEGNWIHDTRQSTQGDGIEIKLGSHGNVVRDNVIHDTGYPCVLTYGTNGNSPNVIEGNVMWNCGDSGIQTAADARIRNNLIFGGASNAFNSQPHQGAVPSNLQFVHNTIIGGQPCVRLSGWDGQPGLVFANNAIYCAGSGFAVGGLTGVTVAGNVINPATAPFPSGSYRSGGTATDDLVNVQALNAYPTTASKVIDAAQSAYSTTTDFNGTVRSGTPDAGAYEWVGATNPGWSVAAGFKTAAGPAPALDLQANPASIPAGGTSQLTWSAPGATSCTATGGWSGARPVSGAETVRPAASSTTYALNCVGEGGASAHAVTVNLLEAPSVRLNAVPPTVTSGATTRLEWSSNGANGCTATGAWSGARPASGSEQTAALTSNSEFKLECVGAGGSAMTLVNVLVTASASAVAPEPDQGGGGASDLLLALLALPAAAVRARRLDRAG